MMGRIALLLMLATSAQAGDWRMLPEQSSLRFIGDGQGERFEGRFGRFEAGIRFDPDALAHARFDVRIDLASADTDNEERDEVLLGPEFFAVERFPRARFVAEEFRALGDGHYQARGRLDLRGVARPVALEFRWHSGDPAILEGRATLRRLEFGVGAGDWADTGMIADEVVVETRLTLRRAD